MQYYILKEDGTRETDEDGRYLPPITEAEFNDYDGYEFVEVERFNEKQGH